MKLRVCEVPFKYCIKCQNLTIITPFMDHYRAFCTFTRCKGFPWGFIIVIHMYDWQKEIFLDLHYQFYQDEVQLDRNLWCLTKTEYLSCAFQDRARSRDGCLTVRSREVSKPRDWMLYRLYHSKIWQTSLVSAATEESVISERSRKSKPESRGFETSHEILH